MQVPGHSGLSSGFSVGLGVVGAGVVTGLGGGGLSILGGAILGGGGSGLWSNIPLPATMFKSGMRLEAVSGLPVTVVSSRGPNVLISEDMLGPDLVGCRGGGGCLMGGGGGRGVVLSIPGSL